MQVLVKENLEIAGGLIANAERGPDGELIDKGNLNIKAGNLIIEKLIDYDDVFLTLGLGYAPEGGLLGTGVPNPYGDTYRIKTKYKNKDRDVYSLIGKGQVIL